MRVVLVGSALDRNRLRDDLQGSGIEVAGEAATISEARAGEYDADAFLIAHGNGGRDASIVLDPEDIEPEPLTPRELDVLALLAEGLPNKSIARRLDISDQTVKFHVAAIYGKLGAVNRTDAVRRAVRRGLVVL